MMLWGEIYQYAGATGGLFATAFIAVRFVQELRRIRREKRMMTRREHGARVVA